MVQIQEMCLLHITVLLATGQGKRKLAGAAHNQQQAYPLHLHVIPVQRRLACALTSFTVTLQVLRLENNRLESLPDTIGELPNSTKLDISTNCLRQLPTSMGRLKRIQRIDAANNMLLRVPPAMGHLRDHQGVQPQVFQDLGHASQFDLITSYLQLTALLASTKTCSWISAMHEASCKSHLWLVGGVMPHCISPSPEAC